jgi:glycyl-tRNA synthetase beta subunit|tara:strand:+ start:435 stop:767 length:333 start_codon:yes stop_codon:yes gene_type:complete
MDIEKIQQQVADLKNNVSLLEHATISDFNSDLVTSLHRITDVLDDLQPRVIDPADLSKEAEQKVLNTLSELTARVDGIESREWTESFIEETVEVAIRNTDFDADIDVYVK